MRSRYEEGVLTGLYMAQEHITLRAELAKQRPGFTEMITPLEELANELGQLQEQVMTGVRAVPPPQPGTGPSAAPSASHPPAQAGADQGG